MLLAPPCCRNSKSTALRFQVTFNLEWPTKMTVLMGFILLLRGEVWQSFLLLLIPRFGMFHLGRRRIHKWGEYKPLTEPVSYWTACLLPMCALCLLQQGKWNFKTIHLSSLAYDGCNQILCEGWRELWSWTKRANRSYVQNAYSYMILLAVLLADLTCLGRVDFDRKFLSSWERKADKKAHLLQQCRGEPSAPWLAFPLNLWGGVILRKFSLVAQFTCNSNHE